MGFLSLCGIGGLLLFACGSTLPVFAVAALLYGCYSGGFFMCMTFHAVSNPDRMARNMAIIEAIVGGTSLIAPVMGILIVWSHNTALPLYLCALVVL